jgi:hypothetical protein
MNLRIVEWPLAGYPGVPTDEDRDGGHVLIKDGVACVLVWEAWHDPVLSDIGCWRDLAGCSAVDLRPDEIVGMGYRYGGPHKGRHG